MRLAIVALAALALAGCETTAEESARLERVAKLHGRNLTASSPLSALAAGPATSKVQVRGTALVHSSEGIAAIVTVRNRSGSTLRKIPVLIEVRDSSGAPLYTNNQPGTASTLTSIPSLPAGGSLNWVDDQVQATGTPASVSAKVGEGEAAGASARLAVSGSLTERSANGGAVEGTVSNPAGAARQEVVVYATARRGGRFTAAGRAVLAEVPARGSAHFQLFLVGDPSGASLQLSASPTS